MPAAVAAMQQCPPAGAAAGADAAAAAPPERSPHCELLQSDSQVARPPPAAWQAAPHGACDAPAPGGSAQRSGLKTAAPLLQAPLQGCWKGTSPMLVWPPHCWAGHALQRGRRWSHTQCGSQDCTYEHTTPGSVATNNCRMTCRVITVEAGATATTLTSDCHTPS